MSEILDASGKPVEESVVTREVDQKYVEKINDKNGKAQELLQEFVNVTMKRAILERREQELLQKIENNKESLEATIKDAYNKMKLDKEPDYTWHYHTDGKFIGIPRKSNK